MIHFVLGGSGSKESGSQGDVEWMQLTQIRFGSNLEQMHKQLKQERIVLEKSARMNLDPGRGDGGNRCDGVQVQEVLADL